MLYKYETLPSAQSIRILTLCPAEQHTDAIECMIETTELEEASYNALSYTWGMNEDGNASQDHELFIHGNRKWITQNLFEGLKRIRLCDKPLRIWIDAVCINQQDVVERSAQVAIMADIYARAEKVLAWLGNAVEEQEDLIMLDLLKRIKKRTEQIKPWKKPTWIHQNCFVLPLLNEDSLPCSGCVAYQQSKSGNSNLTEHNAHVDWLKECFRSKPSLGQAAADMTNVGIRFFSRRYWKRRWILQELSLSNTHHWYWGQHVLDMSEFPNDWIEDLVQAFWLIEYGLREALEDPTRTASVRRFAAAVSDDITGGSPFITRTKGLSQLCNSQSPDMMRDRTWNDLLRYFHSSECSEPKDMYYALASMAIPKICVDYSLTVARVFQQFAETMLDNGEWVWVFYCAATTVSNQHRERLQLPSWVPDPRSVDFHYGGDIPPMGIQISQSDSLVCDVRCLGVLRKHEEGLDSSFHPMWDGLFWQVCSSREPSDEISEVIQPSPLQLQVDLAPPKVLSGDILCSCLEKLLFGDVWIILRLVDVTTQTYQLVGAQESSFALSRSISEIQHAQSFSKCPKIKVRII
ncbi:hypothetical protein P154DRAFT_527292 [Amniculicola lignicola CBS 123094]|uniref:Heterokaryon incompatibility domain-containing protein n=1 Tax=Amniculicola lignicola CBS 123094 TaxID=1392246 RepID=A0A6A5VYW4_9PLEO|nr:hypothetical protein P154DRAFT_527292 [Amniculicola lignicola CBS 123094]